MVVLAVILLSLVAIVVLSAILAGDGEATLNFVGVDIVTSERVIFLAGAVSIAVAAIALWLLVKGLKRANSRRSEMHRLRDAARSQSRDREEQGSVGPAPGGRYEAKPPPGRTGPSTDHPSSGHPSTGPGRGVRSPTDPGEYRGPTRRPDDDERDHFESLPRD